MSEKNTLLGSFKFHHIRFISYGEHSTTKGVVNSTPDLTGVNIPANAYACHISANQTPPTLSTPRHYIDGEVVRLGDAERFWDFLPRHFTGSQKEQIVATAKKEKWQNAVKTRPIVNGEIFQQVFEFRDCDRLIIQTNRYYNAKVMTPTQVRYFLNRTNAIAPRRKEQILRDMARGKWKLAVKINGSQLRQFNIGDEIRHTVKFAESNRHQYLSLMTVGQFKEYLEQTEAIDIEKKTPLLEQVEKENWQLVVQGNDYNFSQYKPGDALVPIR